MARGTVWFDGTALRRARAQAEGGCGLSLDAAVRMLAEAGWTGVTRHSPESARRPTETIEATTSNRLLASEKESSGSMPRGGLRTSERN